LLIKRAIDRAFDDIQLLRACYGGKPKYLSLGLGDTLKIEKVQRDIDWDDFEPTLERYKPKVKQ
jgi:hypothetical protein